MHTVLTVLTVVVMALALVGCGQRASATEPNSGSLTMLDGTVVPVEDVEASIAGAMARGGVPGLSCAILNDGQIVYRGAFGYEDVGAGTENDEQTIFAAASFSKTRESLEASMRKLPR